MCAVALAWVMGEKLYTVPTAIRAWNTWLRLYTISKNLRNLENIVLSFTNSARLEKGFYIDNEGPFLWKWQYPSHISTSVMIQRLFVYCANWLTTRQSDHICANESGYYRPPDTDEVCHWIQAQTKESRRRCNPVNIPVQKCSWKHILGSRIWKSWNNWFQFLFFFFFIDVFPWKQLTSPLTFKRSTSWIQFLDSLFDHAFGNLFLAIQNFLQYYNLI